MSASTARNGHLSTPLTTTGNIAPTPTAEETVDSGPLPLNAAATRVIDIGHYSGRAALESPTGIIAPSCPGDEFLLDAKQVAAQLGVSERFIRDHTYRRLPRIHGIKMGKLIRYRRVDVDLFLSELDAFPSSRRPRRRV